MQVKISCEKTLAGGVGMNAWLCSPIGLVLDIRDGIVVVRSSSSSIVGALILDIVASVFSAGEAKSVLSEDGRTVGSEGTACSESSDLVAAFSLIFPSRDRTDGMHIGLCFCL